MSSRRSYIVSGFVIFGAEVVLSKLYKSRVLVLRRRPIGEADEVLTLLSAQLGCFEACVRGARKIGSVFSGLVEPFSELDGLFAEGRNLDYLTQAQLVHSWPDLRQDIERLCLAAYVGDIVAAAFGYRQQQVGVYSVVRLCWQHIEQVGNSRLMALWGLWHLLSALGVQPNLVRCVVCASPEVASFDVESGGVICADCKQARFDGDYGPSLATVFPLLPKARAALRGIASSSAQAAANMRLDRATLAQIDNILWHYFQYHCPCNVRSRKVVVSLFG